MRRCAPATPLAVWLLAVLAGAGCGGSEAPASTLTAPVAGDGTFSSGDVTAFCSDDGNVIGAAFAGIENEAVPAAKTAAARSEGTVFMTNAPCFVIRTTPTQD